MRRLAVVGGGPAGLMAAEAACAQGVAVDVYEGKGSVGRKFLIAGKGGLNLTHSEDAAAFVARYGPRSGEVGKWLSTFSAQEARSWAQGLGIETFVGTSGRVFPSDMKAAPLLRAWVRRLRAQGVSFHVNHLCLGFDAAGALQFRTPTNNQQVKADATVLALGGGSWPTLGSDGRWVSWFDAEEVATLEPANCGFDANWTDVFASKYAGHPVKSVKVTTCDEAGSPHSVQAEFVITTTGVEGSAIYSLSALIRESIKRDSDAKLQLDLLPDFDAAKLHAKLSQPRKNRTLTEHLRRTVGLDGAKLGLLYEYISKEALADVSGLAAKIKALPLRLVRPRPIDEVISTAGGVRFSALDENLMLRSRAGVFCAGEMIDWEAPTGGYLLTACFASGRIAGRSAAEWLKR